ncbi:two-component regulator propeller domain-containing protein [Cyclobacterium salsum]|uniref:two-component regulator propeller domain-containing protein n=1 Tax=Cyclobacterium salsum TaxID=2666329 RepID=UPI0013919AD7|nr:two-component regulator propeller domain-containing protein [Cyclobacterium salsum]
METKFTFIPAVLLMLFTCHPKQEQIQHEALGPKVVEARIEEVPMDSLIAPKVIPAGNPQVVKAGNPKVVLSHSNVHPAGHPEVVPAGNPKKRVPGKNGLLFPKTVPAFHTPMKTILPEVVTAKEAYWKDQNPYNFSTFSKPQGLKGNMVTSLLEDKNGNIWFGTNYGGFSKYDGKSFYHYYHKDRPNPGVRAILEDDLGSLWFGTQGDGVIRFDGSNFFQFTANEGLSNNDVFSLLKDRSGNLWIGTLGGGVGKFDGKNFTNYTTNEGLNDNFIVSILEDRSGNLWFGSYGGGISKFNGSEFTHFTENEGLSDNTVWSIHEDKNGNIWLATEKGINKFDGKNFFHYTQKEGLSNNSIKAILEDKDGQLWFSTRGGGVNRFDGKTFTHFTEKEGLSINFVISMLEDKYGNLWFGTEGGGVSKYSKGIMQFTDKTGLGNHFISSVLEDRNGNLWFGTFSGGVTKYDGYQFTQYTQNEGLISNNVTSMLEDMEGNIWFGTWKGISKFNGSTFINYTKLEGLSSDMVWSMLMDQWGNLWVGLNKDGVNRFNGRNFTHFTDIPGLSSKTVFSMLEDQKGNLWFGTSGSGLFKYDGENFVHFSDPEGLATDFIWPILEDQIGDIWIGTRGSGLKLLELSSNKASGIVTQFSVKEGLSNNTVTSLLQSREGDLWVGTGNGLNKLNKSNPSLLKKSLNSNVFGSLFTTYTYEDGFSGVGLNHGKTIFEASDGTIWLGGDDRLLAFRPEELNKDTTPPNIQLTGLALFNENVTWQTLAEGKKEISEKNLYAGDENLTTKFSGKEQGSEARETSLLLANGVRLHDIQFDDLSKWYGIPQNLSLPYDNNFITFQFVGVTTQSPKKMKYQYKLEGLDKTWSGITDRSEAPYGNLLHGSYIFKVKAMNGEGMWSSELAYPFEIRPPLWQTWWAYFFYGLLGIGIIIGLRQYTVNRERMKHALKIQKLETEKMYEIDHLKSRFFANISHEFRTPLTLILGPLKNFVSRTEAQNPDKPVFQMMQRNAQRLLHLINQLLDLSKIETGSIKLEPKPVNLNAFLKGTVLSFTSLAERRQIRYHFKYPTGNPVAYIDTDKLEKILFNLLSNAFKFTPEKGEIRVTAQFINKSISNLKSQNGTVNWLEIKVKDSGKGIPADQLEKIFDRFHQIDPAHEQEGSGIGLSLVKELVALHQGEISVKSQVDQGSCFKVTLPLLMADFEEMAISGTASRIDIKTNFDLQEVDGVKTPDPAGEGGDPETSLVLVIEDNEDVRFFIRENLQPNYQVIEATDGEEGYRLALETIPDLILSDVMMPKMDGIALCQKLKTNDKTAHVPLILLTAKAGGEDKIEGLETGADDYQIKPFEPAELLVRIKNLIESRKQLKDHFTREIILQPASVAITSADEKFLQRSMKIIEDNMTDSAFGVEVFCREAGMSRTQLFRKLKALTHYPPGDFIRIMRLKKAAELLRRGAGNIGEVAFMVGFQDPSYFTKSFQKQFGKTPSEFVANAMKES